MPFNLTEYRPRLNLEPAINATFYRRGGGGEVRQSYLTDYLNATPSADEISRNGWMDGWMDGSRSCVLGLP